MIPCIVKINQSERLDVFYEYEDIGTNATQNVVENYGTDDYDKGMLAVTEAFGNIYRSFCDAIYDKLDGKEINEDDYGYPTIDMGVDGVKFFNACVDSQEKGNVWVSIK